MADYDANRAEFVRWFREEVLPDAHSSGVVTSQEDAAALWDRMYEENRTDLEPPAEKGVPPSFMAGVGRGILDIGKGAAQLGAAMTGGDVGASRGFLSGPEADYDAEIYERGRGVDAGTDWGRMVGQAAALAPLAPLTPGSLLGMATAGAVSGALMPVEGPQEGLDYALAKGGQIALGGALGAAGKPIAAGVGALVAWPAKRIRDAYVALSKASTLGTVGEDVKPLLEAAGLSWDKLSEAARNAVKAEAKAQLAAEGKLNPQALANKALLEAEGFIGESGGMLGQVTRDPHVWQRQEQTKRMTGGKAIAERENAQAAKLRENLAKVGETLPTGETPAAAAQGLFDVASALERMGDDYIGKGFSNIRKKFGDTPIALDGVVKWLKGQEEWYGQAPYLKTALKTLTGESSQGGAQQYLAMTADQTELFRRGLSQAASDAYRGGNYAAHRILVQARDKVDDAVESFAGKDVFGTIRAKAAKIYASREAQVVKDIIDGATGANADNYVTRLMGDSRKLSEVKRFLLQPAKEIPAATRKKMLAEGTKAWDGIRAQALKGLGEKSIVERASEDAAQFSGAKFKTALDAMKKNGQFETLFAPEERAALNRVAATSEILTVPPLRANINPSGTAAAIYEIMGTLLERSKGKVGKFRGAADIASQGLRALTEEAKRKALEEAERTIMLGTTTDPMIQAASRKAMAKTISGHTGRFLIPIAYPATVQSGRGFLD